MNDISALHYTVIKLKSEKYKVKSEYIRFETIHLISVGLVGIMPKVRMQILSSVSSDFQTLIKH